MLRGGDMNFGEITEVCPWDVMAKTTGQDLTAPQVKEPRLFKSHCERTKIAKGGKYIYVARNPDDAFVSFFKFLPAYAGLRADDITMHQFADAIFARKASNNGSIWDHYMGWYDVKDDPAVLWVFFEDLKNDLPGQIERVADFMEIPADVRAERVAEAIEKASFRYMKANDHHFDEHFTFDACKAAMGIPEDVKVDANKVHEGQSGAGSKIPEEIKTRLNQQWQEKVFTKTNAASYDDFRVSFPHT